MRAGKSLAFILFLSMTAMASGVYATWQFSENPSESGFTNVSVGMTEITFAPKEILHITDVQLLSTSNNAHNVGVSFTHPTYIASTASASRAGGTVTYKVTVYNNTNVTYWYLAPSWESDFESNGLIAKANGITITTKDHYDDTKSTFNEEDWVPPYTTRDFYITYGFGSNALGSYLSTVISLDFGIKMDAVHDEFSDILNDKISAYGYHYISEIFNQKYAEDGTTAITNIGADKEIFNNLFGGELTIDVNGEKIPVTVTISRKNVDKRNTGDDYTNNGPSGCEYTLFITSDALTSSTGQAMVYAISYSNGGVGGVGDTWYQIGQLYEGTTPVVNNGEGYVPNIDKWVATPNEYEFIDGKTYKVGYEQGDQYDKLKTLEEIISANDQDVYNDIDNSGILRKVYSLVHSSANYNKAGYEGLKKAFEDAAPFYNIYNNGQEVKIRREASRAELLSYMIAIQEALDYFNQTD